MRLQRQITGKMAGIGLELVLAVGWASTALADAMTDTEEPFVAGAGIYQPSYTPHYTGDEDRATQEAFKDTEEPSVQGAGIYQASYIPHYAGESSAS